MLSAEVFCIVIEILIVLLFDQKVYFNVFIDFVNILRSPGKC